MEVWLVEGMQRIALYTNKDLKDGDRLSYNYCTSSSEEGVIREKCHCGAKHCRGCLYLRPLFYVHDVYNLNKRCCNNLTQGILNSYENSLLFSENCPVEIGKLLWEDKIN